MSKQSIGSTAKEFSVHPALIYSLITQQASGAPKALLELIMNCVDAEATRIDVELTPQGYVIADNGKGFKDLDQITSFFGTFGTPHADGDAFYGRFRLGRAQSFGISRSKWYSKDFCMEVDLKVDLDMNDQNAPLGYAVSTGHEFYQGCKIVGEFYDPKNVGSVKDFYKASVGERPEEMPIIPALIKMIRYLPCDVYINGEKVNTSIAESAVSHQTDFAHFILTESNTTNIVNVYNKGVYAYQLTTNLHSGDVVSIDALDLNIARNEAKHTCSIAKRIKNKLKAIDIALEDRPKDRKSVERISNIEGFVDGVWEVILGMKEFNSEIMRTMLNRKVVMLANDKKMSFAQIAKTLDSMNASLENKVDTEIVIYEADLNAFDGNTLDRMDLLSKFFPRAMFPSDELLTKLDYDVEILANRCHSNYYCRERISPKFDNYQDFKNHHCFDFAKANTKMEKIRLLIGALLSFYYAFDSIGDEEEGFYVPYAPRFYCHGIRPLKAIEFKVAHISEIGESELHSHIEKLVDHNVKLTEFEKMVISGLARNNCGYVLGRSREISVVGTTGCEAYTDGLSYIHFNYSFLSKCIAKGDFESLIAVYIHEMCHKDNSYGQAHHGASFYARYNNVFNLSFTNLLNEFYDIVGQRVEKRVSALGTDWLKEVPKNALRKIAKNRLNNRVIEFG